MKKLVIFDLDGTLVNTLTDLTECVNYALGKCNYPQHSFDEYRYFVGNGINKLIERALPEANRDVETIMHVKAIFVEYYMQHKTDKSYVYPGIDDLLSSLQDKGIMLAVASNKYHEATLEMIAHYFPTINFAKVLGQRDGVPTKPHPQIVEEILEATGICKEDVLYVGDSGVDMTTAANAGVDSVGVDWGLRTVEELKANNATYIISNPAEILDIIEQ